MIGNKGTNYKKKERKRSHVLPLPVYARGFLVAVGDVLVASSWRLWFEACTGLGCAWSTCAVECRLLDGVCVMITR